MINHVQPNTHAHLKDNYRFDIYPIYTSLNILCYSPFTKCLSANNLEATCIPLHAIHDWLWMSPFLIWADIMFVCLFVFWKFGIGHHPINCEISISQCLSVPRLQGKIELEMEVCTKMDADLRPAGPARDDPNSNPTLPPPKWVLLIVWCVCSSLFVCACVSVCDCFSLKTAQRLVTVHRMLALCYWEAGN